MNKDQEPTEEFQPEAYAAIVTILLTQEQVFFLMEHCPPDMTINAFVGLLIDQARSPQH